MHSRPSAALPEKKEGRLTVFSCVEFCFIKS